MSYDPISPPIPLATQDPFAPSAPPLEAVENICEAEKSHKSFTITCIALGALTILAGALIGSAFIFGAGIVFSLVGLTSSAPYSTMHIGSRRPWPVIIPCVTRSPHQVTYSVSPPSRSRPIFANQAPPRPTPLYPSRHITVGNGGTIFSRSNDRIQVGT